MGPHPNIVCSRPRLSSHQPYQQGTDLPEGPCVPSVFPVQSLVGLVAVLPYQLAAVIPVIRGIPGDPGGRFLSQSVGLLPKHERPTRTVPR